MSTPYRQIEHHLMNAGTRIGGHPQSRDGNVGMDDPATRLITDFRHVRPFSIEPTARIGEANDRMIACGVRLLFVIDGKGELQGLITSTDVLGEKPVKYVQEHGGRRDDIVVHDIMTPWHQLEVFPAMKLAHASAGDLVESMKALDRQHMLIVDEDERGGEFVSGLVSTTHIERLTGVVIALSSKARRYGTVDLPV